MTTRDRKRLRRVGYRIKRLERRLDRNLISFGECMSETNLLIQKWMIGLIAASLARQIAQTQPIKKLID